MQPRALNKYQSINNTQVGAMCYPMGTQYMYRSGPPRHTAATLPRMKQLRETKGCELQLLICWRSVLHALKQYQQKETVTTYTALVICKPASSTAVELASRMVPRREDLCFLILSH